MAPRWWSLLVFCVAVCRLLDAMPIDPQLVETDDQETLANQEKSISGVQPESEDSERHLVRDKRTIGILRQMFPTLSQIIDRKIQAITRLLFRVIGRLVLQGGAGGVGGGGGGDSGDGGRRISITLPTFPPSTDEDEDEESETESTDDTGTGVSTTQATFSDESPATPELDIDADNQVSESKLSPVIIRKVRQAEKPQPVAEEEEEEEEDDQAAEATGDNELSEAADESEDGAEEQAAEGSEDDPRNKRLVNFSLGGSGGSGGGSGNFLFDIIRLVAGSGTSQAQDEAENAPVDDANITATAKDDGYGAAVPGPLTRLFVIANRGIANLIQDLILRIAQTSERIVNFKARLITSII